MSDAKTLAEELTVDALLEQLQRISAAGHGSAKVMVPYEAANTTVGASPAVGVQGVSTGFDWNQGCVFLSPSKALSEPLAGLTEMRRQSDRLAGRLYRALSLLEQASWTIDVLQASKLREILKPVRR